MLTGPTVFAAAIGYGLALFGLAYWGDHAGLRFLVGRRRTLVYALSLAVYCTSWTYYGSVGLASARGFDFLPIYIGPVLTIGFGHRLVRRLVELARAQNLTTVADFVAARYGKSQLVAALAAFIALMAAAPYMALQLKAITQTMLLVTGPFEPGGFARATPSPVFSAIVTLTLAAFAMAFGARRLNPAERQDGLMLAVAAESLVKLFAFVAVGAFVVWGAFGGLGDLLALAHRPEIAARIAFAPHPASWIAVTALSASAALLLPRQFHVTVVENANAADVKAAAWLFPAYLVAINLFVLPLAVAGLATFPQAGFDRDLTVLALPLTKGAPFLALTTMIGGLSAATAMAVVESVALAITVSNDLVMPILLRRRGAEARAAEGEIGKLVLFVRRSAILGVLVLGYLYARFASDAALAALGLLSFAAVAQIAPAFIGGMVWRRGTAGGAAAGMIVGSLAWAYCLFLPSLADETLAHILREGPLGWAWARPSALTGFAGDAFVGGVALSLGLNVLAYLLVSLLRQPTPARTHTGGGVRRRRRLEQEPVFPALAGLCERQRRRGDSRALPRGRARAPRDRRAVRHARALQTRGRRGGRRADPPRRAPAVAGNRRLHLAARALAAAAAARHVRPLGAEDARRRLRRDAIEPRHPTTRARPRAAGHQRVRLQSRAGRLEPRLRRTVRAAAGHAARGARA